MCPQLGQQYLSLPFEVLKVLLVQVVLLHRAVLVIIGYLDEEEQDRNLETQFDSATADRRATYDVQMLLMLSRLSLPFVGQWRL